MGQFEKGKDDQGGHNVKGTSLNGCQDISVWPTCPKNIGKVK